MGRRSRRQRLDLALLIHEGPQAAPNPRGQRPRNSDRLQVERGAETGGELFG